MKPKTLSRSRLDLESRILGLGLAVGLGLAEGVAIGGLVYGASRFDSGADGRRISISAGSAVAILSIVRMLVHPPTRWVQWK